MHQVADLLQLCCLRLIKEHQPGQIRIAQAGVVNQVPECLASHRIQGVKTAICLVVNDHAVVKGMQKKPGRPSAAARDGHTRSNHRNAEPKTLSK